MYNMVGVKIQMNKIDNLVSLAIMKTQWEKNKTDFIDILKPFIEFIIYPKKDECISIHNIKTDLLKEFGLKIPSNIIEVILIRLTSIEEGYLQLENSIFKYTDKDLETKQFDNLRDNIRTEQNSVIDSFLRFTNKDLKLNYSRTDGEKDLLDYLSKYGSSMIINDKIPISDEESDSRYYVVARFISYCDENDKGTFKGIENIVKGFMIANSMYYQDITKANSNINFNDTCVYIDTSLLIYSLGYSGDEIKDSCLELLKLLGGLGAKLKCFRHNVYEVEGILNAYCSLYETGRLNSSRGFDHLISMKYNSSDILLLITKLETNINSLNIEVEETPSYKNKSQNIGWKELDSYLDRNIPFFKEDRRENDIESIAAIYRLRNGYKPRRIEGCKAIFVTTNMALVHHTTTYFKKIEVRNEYQAIIDDISLTSIAWLKSPNSFPDLPRLHIIADALASQKPNKQFWDRFIEEVEKLEEEDIISPEESLELRYEIYSKSNIMEITSGQSEKISHRAISEVLERNTSKKHEKILAEKQELEKNSENQSKRLDKIKNILESEAKIEAKNKSEYVNKLYKNIGYFITITITTYTAYTLIYNIKLIVSDNSPNIYKYAKMLGLVISNALVVFQVINGDTTYKQFVEKRKESKYRSVYAKEIENRQDLFKITNN